MDQATGHDHHFEPRVEDAALVQGLGRFVEDAPQENQAYAVFVRSPYAHARITSIDTRRRARRARRGRGADPQGAGRGRRRLGVGASADGRPQRRQADRAVPSGAGARARDACRPAGRAGGRRKPRAGAGRRRDGRGRLRGAATRSPICAPRSPRTRRSSCPRRPAISRSTGPARCRTTAAMRARSRRFSPSAAHTARVTVVNQRLVVNTMEPRGATARYDAATDRYTLRSCSQGAGPQRDQLARGHGLAAREAARHHRGCRRRVRPEDARPIRNIRACWSPRSSPAGRSPGWRRARSRSCRTSRRATPSREAELAIDAKGKFLALRVKHLAAMGGYIGVPGAHIQTNNFSRCFPGMYAIPRIQVDVQCVFTNTVPTGPYRGAGRPEANYALERLVDEAARVTGIDPVRLRRRNLIRAEGHSLQDRGRHDLRLGRFRADPRQGAGACALRRVQEAPPRVVQARQAARHRHLVLSRALPARMPTESASLLFRGGQARPRHRRAEHRPGPRHDLSAPDRREARHSGGADRAPAWRHRSWT